jgi:hypothetical protein
LLLSIQSDDFVDPFPILLNIYFPSPLCFPSFRCLPIGPTNGWMFYIPNAMTPLPSPPLFSFPPN